MRVAPPVLAPMMESTRAMKYRLDRDQIVMAVYLLGTVVVSIAINDDPRGAAVWGGFLFPAIFSAAFVVSKDMPRRVIRWSVVALYAVAFAMMYGVVRSLPGWSTPAIGGIFLTIFSGVLVAGVAAVKWTAQRLARLPEKSFADGNAGTATRFDELAGLGPDELRSEGDKPREPIFGPGAPDMLIHITGSLAASWLAVWLTSSH